MNTTTQTTLPRVEITEYKAVFAVNTVHDQMLEFVLNAADERRWERDPKFKSYLDELHKMLADELKDIESVRMHEYAAQGHVFFEVGAESLDDLQRALARCASVCDRWIAKFNVDKMIAV